MALPEDLLNLAGELAAASSSNQAVLRRSISTSYYALFHLLVQEAAKRVCQQPPYDLQSLLERQLEHGHMKKTAELFSKGHASLPTHIQVLLSDPIPPQLGFVAKTFVFLQQNRHQADYDSQSVFTDVQAINAFKLAQQSFSKWNDLMPTEPAYVQVFLLALLFDLTKRR